MADWLRKSLAPLTPEAWSEIEETATRVIKAQLTGRTLVDVDGPHGLELSSVNLGRLALGKKEGPGGVPWGLREVQPLVELRIPVTLGQFELDNISRGCKDADLANLEDATRKLTLFEESAIYNGFGDGQIKGLLPSLEHKPVKLAASADEMPAAVAGGVETLRSAGVQGPYALVLGAKPYYALMEARKSGYPAYRHVRDLLDGPVLWSPAFENGGVMLSTRGGDFELTLGQDIAIGYASHDRENVELYLVESFTFRVLDPAAGVELKAGN